MPKDKDLKRIVRSRMQKTGESYTAARARILARKTASNPPEPEPAPPPAVQPEQPPAPPPPAYAEIAGMSDDAVRAKTGRDWAGWVAVLDAAGAASRPHAEIAAHLYDEHGVPGWWAQMVTVGYERIRGLRDVGQRRGGAYEASKSKTVPVPVARLYRACTDPAERERWLPGIALTVRTAVPGKSMRVTWPDGTSVQLYFQAKGEAKGQIAIQHAKLASRADVEARKAFWAERLDRLAETLADERG